MTCSPRAQAVRSVPDHVLRGDMCLLAALSLACCLVTPVWRPLVDEDEPRYVSTAENMLASGDFIVPRFNGKPRHQKPVLIYWLMAASMAIVGEEAMGGWEWPSRLPSGLAATATALLLYRTLVRRQSRRAAWLAGAGFLAFPLVAIWARAASTDMVLLFLMSATILLGWWASEAEGQRGWWLYLAAAACAGLGFLTKGPVGAAIPMLALGIHWGCLGGLRAQARRIPWVGAVVVFAVSGLTWYVVVAVVQGADFLRPFFLRENLGRAIVGAGGPKEVLDWSRLIVPTVALVGLMPYSPFTIAALCRRPSRVEERLRTLRHLLHTWFWVTLAAFTLPKGQWPSYALPMAAPAALLAASDIDARLGRRRDGLGPWVGVALLTVLWVVAFTVGPSAAQRTPPEYSQGLPIHLLQRLCMASAGLLAIGTVVAVLLHLYGACRAAVVALLLSWLAGLGLFVQFTAPLVVQHVTGPKIMVGHAIAAQAEGQPVLTYGSRYSSLPFYAGRPVEYFTEDDPAFAERVEALRGRGPVWVVTDRDGLDSLSGMWPIEVRADAERLLLVYIPAHGPDDLRQRH